MSGVPTAIRVRPTAILIEDGKILLLEQRVSGRRNWSLPGGAVEVGETIEECLVREVQEETGLIVSMDRLLYVCERIEADAHVIHLTFLVSRQGGALRRGAEPEAGANVITEAGFVPLGHLCDYGFDARFRELTLAGFPESGTYQGSVRSIGL